ncbi:unnamed protein product [Macrosiphum euphorbiae]|uniref:Uncharacterized protein n=1 Tax=Macrosiphum euphorbiae TaxID=13131 RepID=A0AAV0WIT6_9HEMI|nr:unnamed protein product [Macrosiphum euphorbiae]
MTVEIPKQDTSLQLEICELQTDPILCTKEIDILFWITLPVERYPFMLDFALKMVCIFGTKYLHMKMYIIQHKPNKM